MFDIKTVSYIACLLIIGMVMVFNKYDSAECERLGPMFLCF